MQEELSIFASNLSKSLSINGLSQSVFSNKTGLKQATISRYLTGKTEPKISDAQVIAQCLGVSIDELMSSSINENKGNYDLPETKLRLAEAEGECLNKSTHYQIPVVGWAHAGEAMTYDEMPEDYLDRLPVPDHLVGKKMIGLIVDGDSMVPEIQNKDKVAVYTEEEAWSGCLVVSKFNNDEGVSIRRFQKIDEENVRLIPYNTLYAPTNHHLSEFKWIKPVAFIFRDTTNPNKEN